MNATRIFCGCVVTLALVLTACTPATTEPNRTPASTSDVLTTPAVQTTPQATTTGLAAGTDTAMTPTTVATTEGTEAATAVGTAETTPVGTAEATSPAGTSEPSGTETAGQPLLIRVSDLVDLEIVTQADADTAVGEIDEVLVDDEGMVRYVVFDTDPLLGTGSQMVPVEWDMFQINPGDERITLTGTETEIQSMPVIEDNVYNSPGFILTGVQTGTTPSQFNDLIRIGRFSDFDLRNSADEDLGEVEDLVIDLRAGQVANAIVNFGGFLGIGEKSVAVPWERLELNTTDPTRSFFLLDVPKTTLEQAPVIEDLDQTLPRWPETITPTWDDDTIEFWETVGAQ